VIERKNFRKVLRSMKNNRCVWYAPDQDFGNKGAVFVPFFAQPAATITATSKLVALNQSPIVMLSHHRNADNSGYTVTISPIENFPSGDEVKDAAIVNQVIEREIRKAPEQYMWIHRRFKTQPDGRKKLYRRSSH
jgi:KDO2-lipid IV(A) lauroyltransferase